MIVIAAITLLVGVIAARTVGLLARGQLLLKPPAPVPAASPASAPVPLAPADVAREPGQP